jgi:hypothetical protein
VGSTTLNSHFFSVNQIDLDIAPRELALPEDHSRIIDFLETLAHRLDKPVAITPEGMPDAPFASYEPGIKSWRS